MPIYKISCEKYVEADSPAVANRYPLNREVDGYSIEEIEARDVPSWAEEEVTVLSPIVAQEEPAPSIQEDDLYSLNDSIAEWASSRSIDFSDEDLNEAVHAVIKIMKASE